MAFGHKTLNFIFWHFYFQNNSVKLTIFFSVWHWHIWLQTSTVSKTCSVWHAFFVISERAEPQIFSSGLQIVQSFCSVSLSKTVAASQSINYRSHPQWRTVISSLFYTTSALFWGPVTKPSFTPINLVRARNMNRAIIFLSLIVAIIILIDRQFGRHLIVLCSPQ